MDYSVERYADNLKMISQSWDLVEETISQMNEDGFYCSPADYAKWREEKIAKRRAKDRAINKSRQVQKQSSYARTGHRKRRFLI